jgi:hypothetical protein
MPRMTSTELQIYQVKHQKPKEHSGESVDRESKLHEQIIEYCKTQRWVLFHSRMDKKTSRVVGEPDFLIFKPCGQLLLVECKARREKLSEAQQIIKHQLDNMGHPVHVVYSFEEFLTKL